MRTVKVEFEVPLGDGILALTGAGPRVSVSTEVILSDETEDAAFEAGQEANRTVSAFVNGWVREG